MQAGAKLSMQGIQQAMQATNAIFNEEVVRNRNTAALDQVYTADARVLPPGGAMIAGRLGIQHFWERAIRDLGLTSAALETLDAIPAGDGVVEIGEAHLNTTGGAAAVKYVVYWKQEDGRWKWHVDIWNASA